MFAARIRRCDLGLMAAVAIFFVSAGCKTDSLHRRKPPESAIVLSDPANPPRLSDSPEPLDEVIAQQEVDLVEAVLTNRAKYHRSLEQLRAYYESSGYVTKQNWAAFEQEGLKSVKAFRYFTDAEVPSADLTPMEDLEEANLYYEKGLDLMKRGGHGVPGLYREDLMVQASEVFRDLIERFPTSDKIDDAAFWNGEIHKEYFEDQETIAVKWYEKALQWNPNTPHPARFQAAVVYDFRLHDRDRALELYQRVLREEDRNDSKARFATRRIAELTEGPRTEHAATRVIRAPGDETLK